MLKRERGFNLVELLLVIAVVSVLASTLFSALVRAQDTSQQTTCAENLRRLGVAAAMYQADYGDVLVPVGNSFQYGHIWVDLLDPYIEQAEGIVSFDSPKVYRCPSAPEDEAAASWLVYRSYGMNLYCGMGPDGFVPMAQVKYPAHTIRITECWEDMMGGSFYAPMPNMSGWQVGAPGWHDGNNNVLWIDGHVSVMKATTGGGSSTDPAEVMYKDDGPNLGRVWCRLVGPKPTQYLSGN